jgi:predicted DCC family thiol-disulfide oxidoreductase YuxK
MADSTSPAQTAEKAAADVTVFFDGSCPLCRSEIGVYRNCSGADRIAFVDVAQAGPGDVAAGLGRTAALASFHVQTADGRLHLGAAGFSQLLLSLPGWSWLGRASGPWPSSFIAAFS